MGHLHPVAASSRARGAASHHPEGRGPATGPPSIYRSV
jgi:hypothetical protein